jgi:hypothetical protein
MPATLLNAPARPVLTRTLVLILSIGILATVLAFAIGGSAARQEASAADRPAFIRRITPER